MNPTGSANQETRRDKSRVLGTLCLAVVLAGVVAVGLPAGPSVAGAQEAPPSPESGAETLVASDGSVVSAPESGLPPGAGLAYPGDPDAVPSPEPAPPVPPGATSPTPPGQSTTESGIESLIGADGRTRITDTNAYPSRAIGQLTFQQFDGNSVGNYICTGFLIDANTVLTSGHCVNYGGQGENPAWWSSNVAFTPARNGGTAPYGSCGAAQLLTSPEWLASWDESHDFGIIQLDCQVGITVGWFGMRSPVDVDLDGNPLTVRGYPGDKDPGTMWTMDHIVQDLEANLVYYGADTNGGQSGSPVYSVDAADCAGPCALAVHSYGLHGAPPHNTNNHGPRLHDTRRTEILAVAVVNDDSSCPGNPFTDVRAWADPAVDWIWCHRYMTGYAGNLFKPNQDISRAEVARLLYRINGSPDIEGLDPHGFSDVPSWVEDPVRWLAHYDYATGYNDDTFRPDLPISRAQVTRMLFRIEDSPTGAPDHPFTDVKPWADAAVSWIVDPANDPPYATGYPGNLFKPNDDITRGQTSRMTCRVAGATC